MYCRQCGYSNDKYSKMCKRCGSDLTRPTEEYTPAPSEPGKLRFAPQKESFAHKFKRRFRRLERAALAKKRRVPMIIAMSCLMLGIAAIIAVPRIKACMTVVPDTYGSTAGNVATHGAAAINGDFLYCSQPVGDNPGLYRCKLSTGELLKISWHTLKQVSWYQDWLYGIDETGALVRMSGDGLVVQRVIDELNVRYINFFNGFVYYLSAEGDIMRADLGQVSGYVTAVPQTVAAVRACELLAFDGMLYYIAQTGYCYEPLVPMDSVIDPDYEPGKISWITGKEIPPDYRVDAGEENKPAGNVWRMLPDGSGAELLVDEEVCNLSAHGDYLYYMTQTVNEVSASVFDPDAPASIIIRSSSCQFWRFNLKTMKYTRFLDEGTARSALNVSDKAICFISVDGDLETCPVNGGDHVLLATEAQNIDSFAVIDGTVYYTADEGTRVGWITIGQRVPVILWTAEWAPVYYPEEQVSDGDASGADAA